MSQIYLPVTHITYPTSTHFNVIFPWPFWSSKWTIADVSYKILHVFVTSPVLATYTVSCSNLWTFSCEQQRHCTNMSDQPAGICIMLLRVFGICAATGDIYDTDLKTLILPKWVLWSKHVIVFYMDGLPGHGTTRMVQQGTGLQGPLPIERCHLYER